MAKPIRISIAGLLAGSALTGVAFTAQAAPTEQQWQAFSQAVAAEHILPRYRTLAESSAQLQQQSEALCGDSSEATLHSTRQAFHQTMDAWQAIQHVQFGPVELLMRNFSLQFWPDKKNLGGKQLSALLQNADPATLDAEHFRAASVAVKGLPALERLLFADDALAQYQQQPFRCQLTAAITGHVATMSREIDSEWQQYRQEFEQLNGSGYYEDANEAATDLLKSLVEPIEVVRDNKLLRPMGSSASKPKPRRAESWRSGRSLRNIRINLQTQQALFNSGGEHSVKALLTAEGEAALAQQIDDAFTLILGQLEQLPSPLSRTLKDAQHYQQLQLISDELKALHFALSQAMQPLEIQLGFNSRDGD
ncbi:imelysin family protein [Marinobacterium arenosum]|uniref:imelysin family protein n=1 Tax=Marinobacterium arenosum TaxID=2862496 RepID=UPI001C9894D3|nr:imelysin family protein [Marinobacterium arenosum]MBY4676514.1 imelysin family protein [Marinobacterium arenosum]